MLYICGTLVEPRQLNSHGRHTFAAFFLASTASAGEVMDGHRVSFPVLLRHIRRCTSQFCGALPRHRLLLAVAPLRNLARGSYEHNAQGDDAAHDIRIPVRPVPVARIGCSSKTFARPPLLFPSGLERATPVIQRIGMAALSNLTVLLISATTRFMALLCSSAD